MSNWPVITSEAEFERNQLLVSHQPVALPAYDFDNKIIPPYLCKAKLAGAIARVTFTLSNCLTSNTFFANVHSIRVLATPPSHNILPKKRKTSSHDPTEKLLEKLEKRV
jgi:hypothetical protein